MQVMRSCSILLDTSADIFEEWLHTIGRKEVDNFAFDEVLRIQASPLKYELVVWRAKPDEEGRQVWQRLNRSLVFGIVRIKDTARVQSVKIDIEFVPEFPVRTFLILLMRTIDALWRVRVVKSAEGALGEDIYGGGERTYLDFQPLLGLPAPVPTFDHGDSDLDRPEITRSLATSIQVRNHELVRVRWSNKRKDPTDEELCEAYSLGKTVDEIAEQYTKSPRTIQRRASAIGLDFQEARRKHVR